METNVKMNDETLAVMEVPRKICRVMFMKMCKGREYDMQVIENGFKAADDKQWLEEQVGILLDNVRRRNLKHLLRLCLTYKININVISPNFENCLLHKACQCGSWELVRDVLMECPDIEHRDVLGRNAFKCAIDLAPVRKLGTLCLESEKLPIHIASINELLFWGAKLHQRDIHYFYFPEIWLLVDRLLFNKRRLDELLDKFFIPRIAVVVSNFVYPCFPNY